VTEIRFTPRAATAVAGAEVVVVVAPKKALDAGWHRDALARDWAGDLDQAIADTKPGDNGACGSTYAQGGKGTPKRLVAAVLPDTVSRHNSPVRTEAITNCIKTAGLAGKKVAVVLYLDEPDHYLGAAVAVARCFPLFDRKTGQNNGRGKPRVTIAAVTSDGTPARADATVKNTVEAVRLAARLVDTPPEDMKTADVEKEARAAARGITGVRVTSIVGDKLLTKGLGGIHGVGRTAIVPPRLVVLDYKPARRSKRTVALVGKGIIYDTGGLSIKVGGHMSNMKCDMGGSAAVLGAFLVLAKAKVPYRVCALLCLAENAVGPDSYRPDDILTFHSGKTVEINNTDAEGRLVLGDGVSWAGRVLKADVIIDAATLTGAALITTGEAVSCSMSNRGGLEQLSVESGRRTGDLTHPVLFMPEMQKCEFASKVADMRNSVKNRMNAQTSCAGQFIYNHIEDLDIPWLHIDLAGPAFRDGRGTGHGVALISEIARRLEDTHLAE
jgi:probable aminopeptidase NPEPL1